MEMTQQIDYRELLRKYMYHVGDCEGVDFVDALYRHQSDVKFSQDEWAELERISEGEP